MIVPKDICPLCSTPIDGLCGDAVYRRRANVRCPGPLQLWSIGWATGTNPPARWQKCIAFPSTTFLEVGEHLPARRPTYGQRELGGCRPSAVIPLLDYHVVAA